MRGSMKFCQGGVGGGSDGQKIAWTTLFFFFCFLLVLNLFYSLQRGSNGFITEKTILFKGSRGILDTILMLPEFGPESGALATVGEFVLCVTMT